MFWTKLLEVITDDNVVEVYQNFKSYLEGGSDNVLDRIVQADLAILIRAFESLHQIVPNYK